MIGEFKDIKIGTVIYRNKKLRDRYRVDEIDRRVFGDRETFSLVLVKVDRDGKRIGTLNRHLDETDGNRMGWSIVSIPGS